MDLSYGEKSAWISLVTVIIACVWYANSFAGPLLAGTLGFDALWGALIGLIILIVIIESVGHAMVAAAEGREGSARGELTDERDATIDARTNRWPSYILGIGCIAGIFAAALQPPIFTAHVLLVALAAAEIAKLVMQIIHYRRGT